MRLHRSILLGEPRHLSAPGIPLPRAQTIVRCRTTGGSLVDCTTPLLNTYINWGSPARLVALRLRQSLVPLLLRPRSSVAPPQVLLASPLPRSLAACLASPSIAAAIPVRTLPMHHCSQELMRSKSALVWYQIANLDICRV